MNDMYMIIPLCDISRVCRKFYLYFVYILLQTTFNYRFMCIDYVCVFYLWIMLKWHYIYV